MKNTYEYLGFVWLDKYKIGHSGIDNQHQYLFKLANDIVNPYNDRKTVHINILALIEYTRLHFRDEELLMEKYSYTDCENHKKQHKILTELLNKIIHGILTDKTSQLDIIQFMNDWLLRHVISEDMKFGKFLSVTDRLITGTTS